MTLRMTLRWWWARLTGTTIAPPQAFKKSALILEAAHINRQWRDRWESLSPEARAARWADWERRGLAARMPYGTYWATRSGGVTVLREMWEAKSSPAMIGGNVSPTRSSPSTQL